MTLPKLLLAAASLLLVCTWAPCRAEPPSAARLTMLDGEASVIRDLGKAAAPLGLALQAGDIIESSTSAGLVRVEFSDKSILDLGPATRVLLRPPLAAHSTGRRPSVYVLSGWIKLTAPPAAVAAAAANAPASAIAPWMEALTTGTVLMHVSPQASVAFAETQDSVVAPRGSARSESGNLTLTSGQFVSASAGAALQASPQPPAQWTQRVPMSLREKLPSRLDRFAGAQVALADLRDVSYADVQTWLSAEAALRNAMRSRWEPLAGEPAFREELVRNMRQHPEWDRLLLPKKPVIKRAPATAMTTAPTSLPPLPPAAAAPPAPPAAPVSSPAPAPAVAADAQPGQFNLATFTGTTQSAQGGTISLVAYSERKGDATYSLMAVQDGELVVKGEFAANGQSAWAGVGVTVSAPGSPLDAGGYKTLRLRLSAAAGVSTLRVRLLGLDKKTQQNGCYPVVQLPVSAQTRTYDVPLGSFAPEGFCGLDGVTAANTLKNLGGIEVVDAIRAFKARPVQFNVGSIALLR